jgi:predicted GNAT family acetyltransferase
MENVKLELNEKGHGHFYIKNENETIAEMLVAISGDDLTVYHTEVSPKAEGKGLAKVLLKAMADHARQHHLKVTALCPFVLAQFKRHPEEYADIWKKNFSIK